MTANKPTPISSDSNIIRQLETSAGPTNEAERLDLERHMGFKYRASTG